MQIADIRSFLAHRPSAALAVLAPVMVAVIAAVLAYSVSPVVASLIAVVLAIPVAVVGWMIGFRARDGQVQEASVAADIASAQLVPRRSIALLDRDSLLYANWYFMLRLKEEVDRASRYGQKLAILIIRPTGSLTDTEPWQLNTVLREGVRASDVAGHLDRRRVAVILPNGGVRRATQAKRRLQMLMGPVRYDVGCATMPRDAIDHEGLIAVAMADCESRSVAQQAA